MRFPDWHARLIDLIERRKAEPFSWGSMDCCLWVADAVQTMTGRDPAADIRGGYATARSAKLLLRLNGGLEGAGARCGAQISPLCAATGDVGIVHDGASDVLAVCLGETWIVAAREGLGLIPIQAARKAWRVA